MLSATQLAAFQAQAKKALDLTATIQRNPNIGAPVNGTVPDDWPTLASGVACGMKQPTAQQTQLYAALIGSEEATIFSFAEGQDVTRFDRVVVSGTTWTIAAVLTPQSYSTLAQALATRLV